MKRKRIVKRLRVEAKANRAKARELMTEARTQEQSNYIMYVMLRTRALERRDFAMELAALADTYDWK